MKLEFRVPISPRPEFYGQVRLLAHSLARLGPPYADAVIQVSVGESPALAEVLAANRWSQRLPVEWYVVPEEVHARAPGPWWVSGFGRYASRSDADVVIVCDADVCPVDRFDDLLARLAASGPAVAGLQAHYRPFADSEATWRALLDAVGCCHVPVATPYSMDVAGKDGLAPPYFNYGLVAFNAEGFRRVAGAMEHCLRRACELLPESPFAAQVALTFAMLGNGVSPIPFGHEYNCANDRVLLANRLVEPERIRVIHYLRREELDRHRFLLDRERFAAFAAAPCANAINERLRQYVLPFADLLFDEVQAA